jgi:CDP-L-myo-inositol myo-inositolphosphotransferase
MSRASPVPPKALIDGPVSRYLNRPLSRSIARVLAPTPVTPNAVSLASALIAAGAFAAFSTNLPILAGVLIHVSSVIDGVDGDLARLQGTASRFGAVFDATLDRYADGLILCGMAFWSARHDDGPLALPLGFAATVGALLVSYSRARIEASAPGVAGSAAGLATRDMRLFVAAIASVLGLAWWGLAVIAAGGLCTVLYRIRRLRLVLTDEHAVTGQ